MSDLLTVGQTVLSQVQRSVGAAPADVFLLESESRSSDWSERHPENRVAAQAKGLGLRIIREGCLGFGYTNRWDAEAVDLLVRQAVASSQSTAPDPLLDVPAPVTLTAGQDLDLVDKTLTDTPWEPRT